MSLECSRVCGVVIFSAVQCASLAASSRNLADLPALAQPANAMAVAGNNCPNYPCKATPILARPWHDLRRVEVRFNAGVTARVRDGRLSDLDTGALADADVQGVLAKYAAAGCLWARVHFGVSEEQLDQWHQNAERELNKPVANLNQDVYLVLPKAATPEEINAIVADFNALGVVEMAEPALAPLPLPTPVDYRDNQHYLYPATDGGTNAFGVRLFPGGYGNNVRVCDIEYSWNLSHQELSGVTSLTGGATVLDPYNDNNHGTAVLGELFSAENSYGTTGAVPNAGKFVAPCNFSVSGVSTYNVPAAITNALTNLGAGDVLIIEQQVAGPNYTGIPTNTQFGLVPVEWNRSIYNSVLTAIGNRVHVVMAAGNGSQNLDDAAYSTGNGGHYPFQAGNDSGAIIVGAGASQNGSTTERSRLDFSNYGARVNLQGWGENVRTTGYGDWHASEGVNLWYTDRFSGTSSATPIVAGAVAVYNAIMKVYSSAPTPSFTRSFFISYGQPQTSGAFPASQHIGPRPDVLATINGTMLLAPPNNNCASATVLNAPGYGYTTGRVVGATLDGSSLCNDTTNQVDVWYRAVAPSYPCTLWVSTCGTNDAGQTDTGMDTVLSAYTGCGGYELACNDDDIDNPTGCGFNTGLRRDSAITLDVAANQSVLIRVANFSNSVRSAFALGWTFIPINDACERAIDLGSLGSSSSTFFSSLINARPSGDSSCAPSFNNPSVYYRYTACADGTLSVNTCGSRDSGGPQVGPDTVLTILDSCNGLELDCNDDVPALYCSGSSSPLRDSAASAVLTAGQSVIIRVSKYGGTSLGSGSIVLNASFQQSNYCGTSAVAASVGANPFCNLGNHQPAILTTESSCGTNPNIYNAIWFNWVAPSGGSATFDTCGSGFDTKMAVYLACPTVFNNTALACNDDTPGCAAGNNPNYGSRITVDVVGGTQYLVRAGSFSPSGLGLGVLNITFSGGAGACCAGSTCSVVAPADCTGPGTRFIPNLSTCNDAGNNSSPCCKADFNQTDGVTVQDIFDFLTAWFGADPTADFNGISGVGVQDIFDFLAAWFQGC